MYLKSLMLKGFKSFPGRTKLNFAPGVSVIVGPNGCGKSNITDAVLWALGEQSPIAVRGQTMQDVIFAGGPGQGPRRYAEVEVVIDNSEGRAASEFAEISISRRLNRSGEGEYRLNGARCRMVDVLEVLADTNMGREMHSVISQGRVEQVVSSKPRERRLLIEEAAGLGKHRKRRRRAELRLERTQENLDRALDVEREARSRMRPLKQQAEAADLHSRLERQELELRAQLVAERLRAAEVELTEVEQEASAARGNREAIEERLAEVAHRREAAEARLEARDRELRDRSERLLEARSARAELGVRRDSLQAVAREIEGGLENRRAMLAALDEASDPHTGATRERIAALEAELEELDRSLKSRAEGTLGELVRVAERATARHSELESKMSPLRTNLEEAERQLGGASAARDRAEAEAETAKRRLAALRGELEAVEARLAAAASEESEGRTLASLIQSAPGMEHALTAVLGERLRAEVIDDLKQAASWLGSGEGPARAFVRSVGREPTASDPPTEGAQPLLDLVEADADAEEIARRLLGDAWLVEDLGGVRDGFEGIAVTIEGHVLEGASGELRRLPRDATDPALTARSAREELVYRVGERERTAERAAAALEQAAAAHDEARDAHERAARELREATRALEEAAEDASRKEWLLEQRRSASQEQGPEAVRRAQIEAELAAERRHAESAERARAESERRRAELRERIAREEEILPGLGKIAGAIAEVLEAVEARVAILEAAEPAEAPETERKDPAAELRACSAQEAEIQGELRTAAEAVTEAEVAAAQTRDRHSDAKAELDEIARRLDRELEAAERPLTEEEHDDIERKLERLAARRERIGPVNPLAQREYEEARTHLDELKAEREDLSSALTELKKLIREIDREIARAFDETFQATAANFEEMVGHLFPGGHGRLRVIDEGPREAEAAETTDQEGSEEEDDEADEEATVDLAGVEIEVAPAGKQIKRLTMLSGGEKSLVALAFVFAVFLARPCPFYILDEVEAALDDANIDRFLQLVRRFSERSQFVIVTHQKRTMDAADVLYGVSMGNDGVTKIVSKRLPREAPEGEPEAAAQAA